MALPVVFFASCDDNDNNLPNVNVSIDISGGVRVDDIIYVVKGDTLKVEKINVVNREQGKNAIINSASYSWDYHYMGISTVPPFGASIVTDDMEIGHHLLQIECPVYAVDKSAAKLYMAYKVDVVSSSDDIPEGTVTTSFSDQFLLQDN